MLVPSVSLIMYVIAWVGAHLDSVCDVVFSQNTDYAITHIIGDESYLCLTYFILLKLFTVILRKILALGGFNGVLHSMGSQVGHSLSDTDNRNN